MQQLYNSHDLCLVNFAVSTFFMYVNMQANV